MTDNPWRSPEAKLGGEPPQRKRPWLGVSAGLLADIGGTVVVSIVLVVGYAFWAAAAGHTEAQIAARLDAIDLLSPFGLMNMAAGFSMSMLGGWICVALGRVTSLAYPLILGVLVQLAAGLIGAGWPNGGQAWVMTLLSIGFTLFGAYLALRRRQ